MLAIGVDIGGTKIAAGVVDEDGNVLAQTPRATEPDDASGIHRAVADAYAELTTCYEAGAVAVAAAGFVDTARSTVLFAPNIAWRDYPLRERLQALVGDGAPVVMENDANAAGGAEFRFGAGQDVDDMLMLTVGTGLGGAIVANGKFVRGAWSVAAEVGHLRVVPGGHYCGCGHEGCWSNTPPAARSCGMRRRRSWSNRSAAPPYCGWPSATCPGRAEALVLDPTPVPS